MHPKALLDACADLIVADTVVVEVKAGEKGGDGYGQKNEGQYEAGARQNRDDGLRPVVPRKIQIGKGKLDDGEQAQKQKKSQA